MPDEEEVPCQRRKRDGEIMAADKTAKKAG